MPSGPSVGLHNRWSPVRPTLRCRVVVLEFGAFVCGTQVAIHPHQEGYIIGWAMLAASLLSVGCASGGTRRAVGFSAEREVILVPGGSVKAIVLGPKVVHTLLHGRRRKSLHCSRRDGIRRGLSGGCSKGRRLSGLDRGEPTCHPGCSGGGNRLSLRRAQANSNCFGTRAPAIGPAPRRTSCWRMAFGNPRSSATDRVVGSRRRPTAGPIA